MILIKGREMLFSNREQYLGSTADNNSEVRIFKIDRLRSVDIAHLMFKIDLEYSNGGKDSCSLEKEVTEESIFLQWTIPSEVLQVPGPIFGNIRATDEIGAVKWSSFCGVFYSEEAINTPGAWEGKLTELEKTEALVEEYKKSAESAASEAEASKNEAKEAKETTVSAMNDTISAKKVSVESANAAVEAKTEAESARDAAQLAKEQTEQISGAGIATTEKVGLVRPDGETVEVGETGLIKVPKATTEKHGLVRPDGETIGLENDLLKSLVTAAGLKTNDTNGLLGTENAEVMLQALIDNITNRVVNQILTKTMLVNNALTTEEGKFPADAAYLKVLKGLIDQNAELIRQLNSDPILLWSGDLHEVDTTPHQLNDSILNYRILFFSTNVIPSRSPEFDNIEIITIPNILMNTTNKVVDITSFGSMFDISIHFIDDLNFNSGHYKNNRSDDNYIPGLTRIYGLK